MRSPWFLTNLVSLELLDFAGTILSLANRLLLRQSYPTMTQLLFWDRWIVPLSRVLDPLTGFRFGKTITGVWRIDKKAAV
jgi:hypothetical protein